MQNKRSTDITSKGLAAGLLIPFFCMLFFFSFASKDFENMAKTIEHYQTFGLTYKILSLSLMPGAGLFFTWSKNNKMNQARGTLLATLMYGVVVLVLYFS